MTLGQEDIGVGAHMQPQLLLEHDDRLRLLVGTYFTHGIIWSLPHS